MTPLETQDQADCPQDSNELTLVALNEEVEPTVEVVVREATAAEIEAEQEAQLHTLLCSIQGKLSRAKVKIVTLTAERDKILEALRG